MPDNNQQNQLINLQAQQLAAQVANWAAQLEFQKERMRLLELPEMQGKAQIEIDKLAWEKAEAEWDHALKEATLTGTYKGQPTLEWMTQQAQLTGVLNGQQTLQGKLTDAQITEMNRRFNLANQEFLTNATGYVNGQKTFDREKFEAGQASDAWKFLATLTGPANAFKQAKAISTMPGGMQGIMEAWAGKYSPAGFGAVGSGGQATMESLIGGGGPGSPYYYPPPGNYAQPGQGGYLQPTPPPGPPGGTTPPPPPGGGAAVIPPPTMAPGGGAGPAAPTQQPGAPMDAGFYVWLRVHNRIPDPANAAAELPGLIAAYNTLPAYDHQQYITTGQTDPTSFQYTLPGSDTLGIPANPWLGQATTPEAAAGISTPTGVAPGRGFTPDQWNDATRQAVAAWNTANPGWVADGSQTGYHWVGNPVLPGYGGTTSLPPGAFPAPPGSSPPPASPPSSPPSGGGPWDDPNAPFVPGPPGPYMPIGGDPPPGGSGPLDSNSPQYADIQARLAAGTITREQAAAEWAAIQGGQWNTQPPVTKPVIPQTPFGSGPPGSVYALSSPTSYSYQPSGVQAPASMWNYSPGPTGSMNVAPPGVQSDYSTPDISSAQAMSPGQAYNLYQYGQQQAPQQQTATATAVTTPTYAPGTGGTTATAGPFGSNPWTSNSMPLPNQINAENYANSYEYQRELGWAAYEDAGWDKGLAQEAFKRSLPTTGGPKKGSFAF